MSEEPEPLRVEHGTLAVHGGAVEVVKVIQQGRALLAFEFGELDEAEHVGRELLRLAAEWRAGLLRHDENPRANLPLGSEQEKSRSLEGHEQ